MGLIDRVFEKQKQKCPECRKFTCRCTRLKDPDVKNEIAPRRITNSKGVRTTVHAKTGNRVDANGNVWCGSCHCRVMAGKCTNARCSTKK